MSFSNDIRAVRAWLRSRGASQVARARTVQKTPLRFTKPAARHLLLVSLADDISQSQVQPFHHYAERWGRDMETLEMHLDIHLARPDLAPPGADVVCFQCWIGKTDDELRRIAAVLRGVNPGARLVFLDPFAPADLRYARALDPLVDVYVKKHVLRDRSRYGQPTLGDTNLSDWCGRRYGLSQESVRFEVPPSLLAKLVVGPTFFMAPYMRADFEARRFPDVSSKRRFDLHARLGGGFSDGWYGMMRREAIEACAGLTSLKVTDRCAVGKLQYLRELTQSQLCFSPFGYGEVSWRDYEAIHAGAVLLKPDMSHIETEPDVFIPHQTYVPLAWDLHDLESAAKRVLDSDRERTAMARRAFELLADYAASDAFNRQMRRIVEG
jgi:SAM-dependent methyltransferase